MQQPVQQETLPHGAITQQGTSFLQQFIIKLLEEKGVPLQTLRFVPKFGEQIHQLLYGDPYVAHTYFADMLYHVQQLLDQDSDFDPVEVTRRAEFAEAEKRASQRAQSTEQRTADFGCVASSDSATGGPLDGAGTHGVGEVHSTGFINEKVPRTLSYSEDVDY